MTCVVSAAEAQLPVETIVQRSVQANEADWAAAPEYDWYETDQEDGEMPKTYQMMMVLGSPCKRLVAVNGKKVSEEVAAQEQRKLDQTIARRRAETPQQRADRIAKYEKDRKRDHLLMQQLTEAFQFKLLGQQRMGPYQVYALKATPRPDYRPPNTQAQVLTGMQGKLWIDTKTFQWVKVEARVTEPVSIEGFLATVEPGTRFELVKAPVDGNIWQPVHFAMKSKAKVLFLFTHRSEENDSYFGYHKASSLEAHETSPGSARR